MVWKNCSFKNDALLLITAILPGTCVQLSPNSQHTFGPGWPLTQIHPLVMRKSAPKVWKHLVNEMLPSKTEVFLKSLHNNRFYGTVFYIIYYWYGLILMELSFIWKIFAHERRQWDKSMGNSFPTDLPALWSIDICRRGIVSWQFVKGRQYPSDDVGEEEGCCEACCGSMFSQLHVSTWACAW